MEMDSSQSYPTLFTDLDRHLIGEGQHHRLYEKLGAQVIEHDGQPAVHFSVWAPNARQVQVVGDFNDWDGSQSNAYRLSDLGLWELRIPGARPGDRYKFRVQDLSLIHI